LPTVAPRSDTESTDEPDADDADDQDDDDDEETDESVTQQVSCQSAPHEMIPHSISFWRAEGSPPTTSIWPSRRSAEFSVDSASLLGAWHKRPARTINFSELTRCRRQTPRLGKSEAISIRFELRLLRWDFFVSAFGAHVMAKAANSGLCDDQLAAGEF